MSTTFRIAGKTGDFHLLERDYSCQGINPDYAHVAKLTDEEAAGILASRLAHSLYQVDCGGELLLRPHGSAQDDHRRLQGCQLSRTCPLPLLVLTCGQAQAEKRVSRSPPNAGKCAPRNRGPIQRMSRQCSLKWASFPPDTSKSSTGKIEHDILGAFASARYSSGNLGY